MTDDAQFTVDQAAEVLGLSPITVRRAFREGRLAGSRVPNRREIRITGASIDHYRRVHLGRPGRPTGKCLICRKANGPRHKGHPFTRDPRTVTL